MNQLTHSRSDICLLQSNRMVQTYYTQNLETLFFNINHQNFYVFAFHFNV